MNLITAAAVYTGDDTTVSGLRTMRLAIAGTGKKPTPIPLFVLPSFAAGDTCAAGAPRAAHCKHLPILLVFVVK